MAGQPPQEPPWQPQGQDHGRQDWQSYSPPTTVDGQETYAYPHSGTATASGYGQEHARDRAAYTPSAPQTRLDPAVTQHDQVYLGAEQPYAGADQPYAGAEQPYAGTDQPYAGPSGAPGQDQGAPQWQDQGMPQWQGQAASQWKASRQGSAKAAGASKGASKGFVSSLFDLSFNSFVTPKIIKALYVLGMIWTVIWALIFLRLGFKYGGAAGGIFTLIVAVPVFGLLMLGAYRMLLEFFMVMHRVHDELKVIREQSDNRL